MGMMKSLTSSPAGIFFLIILIIFLVLLFAVLLLGFAIVLGAIIAFVIELFPLILIIVGLGIMYFLGWEGMSVKWAILGFIIIIIGILTFGWI